MLLWLLGVPIPILVLIWAFGGLHWAIVGWVEPTGRANARPMTRLRETHHGAASAEVDGFRCALPILRTTFRSNKKGGHRGRLFCRLPVL